MTATIAGEGAAAVTAEAAVAAGAKIACVNATGRGKGTTVGASRRVELGPEVGVRI